MTPYYDHGGIVIYHGDALEIDAWLDADALVCDPPYGMGFASSRTTQSRPIANDCDTAVRDEVLKRWPESRPALVFGTWKVTRPACHTLLVWDKSDGVGPGMGDLSQAFGTSHEEIYLLGPWPKRMARRPSVIRTACGMASFATRTGHPTPKPVGLMVTLIEATAAPLIADPFMGSGSTLVAAKQLGRRAIGVELEERYCEIAAKRLAQECLFT